MASRPRQTLGPFPPGAGAGAGTSTSTFRSSVYPASISSSGPPAGASMAPPTTSAAASSHSSSALAARVEAKRAELQNLQQLRDTSGALAARMQELEQKLATLRDGTEAVACVMANWSSVLGTIQIEVQ
ncbi:hypothetical protein KEM52_004776, partial [Ascosphaera acerosa]